MHTKFHKNWIIFHRNLGLIKLYEKSDNLRRAVAKNVFQYGVRKLA